MRLPASAALAALLALAAPAHAQDLAILGGATQSQAPRERTFAGMLSYEHELARHLSASVAYRNEGHVPGHHRDGHSAQLWLRSAPLDAPFSLALGAGAYRYFDTAVAETPDGFTDAHGWAGAYGIAATWTPRGQGWFWQARVERIEARHGLDSTQVLVGAGVRLDQDGTFPANASGGSRRGEVTFLAGQTIVNSFESQQGTASSIEVRHAFGPAVRMSVAALREGDTRLHRRKGVVVEGWLEPSLAQDRYSIGVGLGSYLAVDDYQDGERRASGIVSITASWRLTPAWVARFTFHRISTRYDRDSDILLVGLGLRY